jgi:hypothetical protein
LEVASGRLTPLSGKIYEQAQLPDGTRLELLEFRPFTVETMRGERPQDVGPSVDYLVQPPDRPAVQLRAYLNHVDFIGVADGQKTAGMDAGAVVYRPVLVGLPRAELWPVAAAVSRLASPTEAELRRLLTPALAPAATEAERVAAGLGVLQAARVLRELNLSHVLVLDDFELRRYTGLMVAYDPAVKAFWAASLLLLLGVVLMLGRRMSRVWLAADGSALVTSPHGRRQVAEVVQELVGDSD